MAMREALIGEIRNWLQKHGQDPSSPDIRTYLKPTARLHLGA
jgi:hypothetical protein